MSAEANVQTIQKIYAAFGRGDVPAILEFLSDDVKWSVCSRSAGGEKVPWHLRLVGKTNVPKFFLALGSSADFTKFEPHAFVANDEFVYCTVSWEATYKPNGKKLVQKEVFHRFTFKNGRIVEWIGTEDTALTVEGVTGK